MKTYLVGGAVRDLLMGMSIQDRDYVVVGSSPEEMLALGYEQVGSAFPVFLHPRTGEEYALARTEVKTGAGYGGFETYFGKDVTIEEDLARRDLTINSIAYDEASHQYIDPYGGMDDMNSMVLRHTSSAFKEDPLRVIRLARFAARFTNFSLAPTTFLFAEQMVKNGELNELSHERFAAEVQKVFDTCTPDGCVRFFALLHDMGVFSHVNFFKGLNGPRMMLLAYRIKLKVPKADRMTVFTALARGDHHVSVTLGGSEGGLLRRMVGMLTTEGDRVSTIMSVFRLVGWQNVGRMCMLRKVMEIGEELGDVFAVESNCVPQAFQLAAREGDIGSRLSKEGVSGAEIGKHIDMNRREVLRVLLCNA